MCATFFLITTRRVTLPISPAAWKKGSAVVTGTAKRHYCYTYCKHCPVADALLNTVFPLPHHRPHFPHQDIRQGTVPPPSAPCPSLAALRAAGPAAPPAPAPPAAPAPAPAPAAPASPVASPLPGGWIGITPGICIRNIWSSTSGSNKSKSTAGRWGASVITARSNELGWNPAASSPSSHTSCPGGRSGSTAG